MPQIPLSDWQGEQARLTVFPMPHETTRREEWWQEVTGDPPDELRMNPKKGSGLIQGNIDPGMLMLRLEPGRIDWVLKPKEPDMEELAAAREFPVLGPSSEMVAEFSAIAEKWLTMEGLPSIARMAFGALLIHPMADRRAAYLRLPDLVPVRVDPDSSDFLYQINLPPVASSLGIEGLLLNRLSKWSVVGVQLMAFRYTGSSVQPETGPELVGLRVELDINTVPAFAGPIPRERLIEIFRELIGYATSLASDGVSTT